MKIFSVIIPAHNAGKTIVRTLASLISNKDQILEVILVNDRSIDNTVAQARKFKDVLPLKIIKNKGEHNPGAARKMGLLVAQGEWVTFVDADDCLTASSLRYVEQHLSDDLVLLYCQSIYYETGTFKPEDICHSDESCGGNFYRRDYLLEHELFPHDTLKMSEDEYFNSKIRMYLEYIDPSDLPKWDYYDYPVYEVHHDFDLYGSFASDNYIEYAIKWHLLSATYLAEDFLGIPEIADKIEERFMNDFIFVFLMYQGLRSDEEENVDANIYSKCFKDALNFYIEKFNESEEDLIEYYYNNLKMISDLYQSAVDSIGRKIQLIEPFGNFIRQLKLY